MDTENTGILGIRGFSRSAKIHGMQRYRKYRDTGSAEILEM